jgi:putative intracellular protease/amidase
MSPFVPVYEVCLIQEGCATTLSEWVAEPSQSIDKTKNGRAMKRRKFLQNTALTGAAIGVSCISGAPVHMQSQSKNAKVVSSDNGNKLTPPTKGKIAVAFLISRGATMIDYAGPWEVFQDVHSPNRGADMESQMPFELFTISDSTDAVIGSGGLKIVPNYSFQTAPLPRVIVIPAQGGRSEAMFEWLRKASKTADVVMSVCTGAFILAKAGMLAGKPATTHHGFIDMLAKEYPDIDIQRGFRFIEGPKISTAGGLTSGIDLALRVVERYFGRDVAQATADYMEYQSRGWVV